MKGTVVEAKGERLKILLEDEVYGLEDISFCYKWNPESGNLFYCMPETGTSVTLYSCNEDEQSGICINCKRENSVEVKKIWKRLLDTLNIVA